MVAINKLTFIGTLLAAVVAVPISAPQFQGLTVLEQAEALATQIAHTEGSTKRDLAQRELTERGLLAPVFSLLGEVGTFLQSTLTNLLSLDLSSESTELAQLLVNVNAFLVKLENALKNYSPTSGLGGALQNLLINSGLQSLVLGLTTIVSQLVAFLIGGGTIDPTVQAEIVALNNNLTALGAAFQAAGASSTGLDGLSTKLTSALNSSS